MRTTFVCAAAVFAALISGTVFGQSLVGRNTNAVGPTPDGFYKGIPHYQDNEPHCDRNPLLPSNIICMGNGYGGADDDIGDAWPRIYETQDNARTWLSRYATGSAADTATSLGLGFGADPIMVCWPGGCGGFFIASNRAEGGGTGGGVYMQLMPEFNIEAGFRHFSEAGPRTVQSTSGGTFLDKIDAIYLVDTQNPGIIEVTTTVNRGGFTESVTRTWPRGRLIVVYAAINSSQQNIRIYSTYSDDYGANWSPPKQVANTTGLDTGVAVAAIDDTVLYAYRQFQDDSGDQLDAVFAAVSTTRGRTVRKPFAVVEDLCAFDQPTVAIPASTDPDSPPFDTVASRTNNFVDVSSDGSNFVMVLAEKKRDLNGDCSTQPFDYPAGSRVLVTTAGSNGRGWSTPTPIAPLADFEEPRVAPYPRDRHSFQFMPAVDCELGVCQAIWYDSINDSNRNISFLTGNSEAPGFDPAAADAFINFPLFGDFFYPGDAGVLQFRRTADVWTRQFKVVSGNIDFSDTDPAGPVQVSKYQLAAIAPSVVVEVEQNPFSLKQYKGNTVSFMGDYIGLASRKVRSRSNPDDPTGPPIYEPNYGPDLLNPALKPSWFAYWTDTRKARGQLYTEFVDEAVPFLKTDAPTGGYFTNLEESLPDSKEGGAAISGTRKLSAEGVEDSNAVGFCLFTEGSTSPGQARDVRNYPNRIKDADVYGALIKAPATAWVLNASKGLGLQAEDENGDPLGDLQRTYVIAARNESKEDGKTFRFEIANQPTGEGHASWLQFEPKPEVYEDVGPQSSVTVALFVVSDLPVNLVTVNVYEVPFGDRTSVGTLVETLEVNGALEAGDLINAAGTLIDINARELHNPFVYAPNTFDPEVWNPEVWNPEVWNPEVWNPEVWNPEVWNPEVWNPEVWNPEVWNPEVWNPEVWNPEVWNPEVWNVNLTDGNDLDNSEIPSPDLIGLEGYSSGVLVAKLDVQFSVENSGNTITPYTADFAANSQVVRDAIAAGDVRTQIIVWQDVDLPSYQGCDPDVIVNGNTPGQNRILAVANNADLLHLKIPSVDNNRFGSVTYYSAPREKVQITIRFAALEAVLKEVAPEIVLGGISYVVTSQAANTGSTSLNEDIEQRIVDNIPPNLVVSAGYLPLPIVLAAERQGGLVGVDLNLDPPLVTASKEDEADPVIDCGPHPLGAFAPIGLGTTQFDCSATSENGATGTINFGVSAEDQEAPVLDALPADIILERELLGGTELSETAQPQASTYLSLPTATDNIDLDSEIDISCGPISPGGVAPFTAPGPTQTEIRCTATDGSGNTDEGSFFVKVQDTLKPTLTLPAPISKPATSSAGADVVFAASATDLGGAVNVDVSCRLADNPAVPVASGDSFPIGTTTVECMATDDAGLQAVDTFDIIVADTTPPIFKTTVADITVEANTIMNSVGGAFIDFEPPTATDFGELIHVDCDMAPDGAFYPLQSTPTKVTCATVPDSGGLTASTSFTVTVVDTTPPDLTVPADITTITGPVTFAATATDVADESPVVTCDPPSGSVFAFGTATVTCTATDESKNSSDGTFTVTANLAAGAGLDSNKNSVKAGSVAGFTWVWLDGADNPVDVGENNQDIEAWSKIDSDCSDLGPDLINEDPGSSDIRRSPGGGWQFNWQTVYNTGDAREGEPLDPDQYCVSVRLLSDPSQRQTTEIRVRP